MKTKKHDDYLNFLITKMNNVNYIHFVGIGGVGMSRIAEILLKQGYIVSGSDLVHTCITKKLINLGVKIFFKHSKKNVKNANVVVISSAISHYNPEVIQAKILNIPIILRGEMLAEIIRYKYGIAFSGTHGKTTTSAITFNIFYNSNLDPTLINGGYIKNKNNKIQLGNSPYYIIEADESDASFLYLRPIIIVLTNINNDHLENYHENFDNIKLAYIKFIKNLPFYGTVIICIDDKNARSIISSINCNIITYGFSLDSDVQISEYKQQKFSSNFTVTRKNKPTLHVTLNIPGKHNALNATAAITVATKENISDINILKSLKNFRGVERRFELCGKFLINNQLDKNKTITIIKDYGHHPNEISASIDTARSGWPRKNLIMVFQPHRYTRTYYLFDQFINTLLKVDELFILEVYSANENIISGSDSLTLYNELYKYKKMSITLIYNYNTIFTTLIKKLSGNDLLLIQGAGDINVIIDDYIIKNLKKLNKE
ncbi:UDP-N-acetylmuramate--L-alanine ligase [Buchnera aphidicola]|uniref:UDP-N-acetylmuramate--L-alanine ligase n=1 Tax=Buchnera aphidicola subsp. Melaphis rhois TaxID=118103 RepID=A0A4D6Y3P9_BUCMH|nr:UDP-N-acetylmuramate--L-alanine ligase [Buchnera aphidicola]QCI23233.1 UDP-N-acetylmuramate--L-alanine ligase [Buchnera aphidicola (Melaphis rhois)]